MGAQAGASSLMTQRRNMMLSASACRQVILILHIRAYTEAIGSRYIVNMAIATELHHF